MKLNMMGGFPGNPVVKNLLAMQGIPVQLGPGRFHMLWDSGAGTAIT